MNRSIRRRHTVVHAGLVAVLAAAGIGIGVDRSHPAAQGKTGAVQAPMFEVDPLWPKPLPNHWVLGSLDRHRRRRAGSRLDHPSQIANARDERQAARTRTAVGDAARARRRSSSSIRRATCCATGAGPGGQATSGPIEPRHHHRLQGQRLDWRQPAADSHILKFTKDGKFLMQVGKRSARRASGHPNGAGAGSRLKATATTWKASAASRRSSSIRRRTRRTSPTAICNKRVAVMDADTGKIKRFWGAYGNKPDDSAAGARTTRRGAAGAAVAATRSTARCCRKTISSTSATASRRPHPGLHAGRASS